MRSDLEQRLFADFPELYRGRHLSPRENLMCFGFECDDGWYDLLHELSAQLTAMIRTLPPVAREECFAVQVKEKFGGLRFYMTCATDEMYEAISVAEDRSLRTCEVCGGDGRPRGGGWIRTLCDQHANGKAVLSENG